MNSAGILLRIMLVVTGLYFLGTTVSSLAKRKMHESFCLAWGGISIAIALAGLLLHPYDWWIYISGTALILILAVFYGVIFAAYFISIKISELIRKNQELSIQVALLMEENERRMKSATDYSEENVKEL